MEVIQELGKMLLIGSGLGIFVGVLIRINQYKSNKNKETFYNPPRNEEALTEEVDYKSLWEEEKRKNSK